MKLVKLRRLGAAGQMFDLGQDRGVSFEPVQVVEFSELCALELLRDDAAGWAPASADALPILPTARPGEEL